MTQEILIKLLEEQILKITEELESNNTNPIIEKYQSTIKNLKRDKNSIREIDLSIIEEILDELEVPEKKEILNYFDIIKRLLILNKEKNTTYKLTESQLEYINIFIKIIDNYEKKIKEEYDTKLKLQKEYQNILNKLKEGQERITELNTIKHLFKSLSIKEEEQSRILITLMKYNKNISYPSEDILPNWDI